MKLFSLNEYINFTITWRMSIEILFLTILIYSFIRWISADTQKNLVGYFYIYWAVTIFAYYNQLYTISTLYLVYFPLFIIFLYLIHQQTLQKNFIALKKINIRPSTNVWWVDELMRFCLYTSHKHKDIICIIEKTDSVLDYIKVSSFFNADISTSLLNILFDIHHENPIIFVLDFQGKLITFNADWNLHNIQNNTFDESAQKLPLYVQQALFISQKTDAFIFASTSRLFNCFIQGILIENISIHQLKTYLCKYQINKEKMYEIPPRTYTSQQEYR